MQPDKFFRIFPPPQFLAMNHAGLDISDDAIRCLEYGSTISGTIVEKFHTYDLKEGIFEGGEIKDELAFVDALKKINEKAQLSYVKVSIPEEKAYLFQTEVAGGTLDEIRQNIEFKLEENVPIPVSEALFYFDILPMPITGGTLRASVSVVSQVYIEKYISILNSAGMLPVSFELAPKATARSVVAHNNKDTHIIVHFMNKKTAFYVVSEGVVCFSSTLILNDETKTESLKKELTRIYQYWITHAGENPSVHSIILVGKDADKYENLLHNPIAGINIDVKVANIWINSFDINSYIPPISKEESLTYAVSSGLAMPLVNT
jgi:Tfp pilus assembly PilM family ATPase